MKLINKSEEEAQLSTQFSGYDQYMRAKVIFKVLNRYDEKVKSYSTMNKMYKSRQEQYDERRKRKDIKKENWYNKERYDGIMFADVTKDGELLNEVKRACKRNKPKIKVVEKMHSTIKREIQRSNPFQNKNCGRKDCVLCERKMNIDCRTRGCVYEI